MKNYVENSFLKFSPTFLRYNTKKNITEKGVAIIVVYT